ncbi:hypothetical protein MC885_015392 [Smutsia gigantea]|nr:hypothetical protein MC885_015392 [Smutsia gigantea]
MTTGEDAPLGLPGATLATHASVEVGLVAEFMCGPRYAVVVLTDTGSLLLTATETAQQLKRSAGAPFHAKGRGLLRKMDTASKAMPAALGPRSGAGMPRCRAPRQLHLATGPGGPSSPLVSMCEMGSICLGRPGMC